MSSYGKKGGTGPTAGKKSEVIAAGGHSKRVFHGQRYLVVYPSGIVTTAHSPEEVAERYSPGGTVLRAETVDGKPYEPEAQPTSGSPKPTLG